MAETTYYILAEKILTTYYRGQRSDDSSFSLKHVAQLAAEEIAAAATANAQQNAVQGETTYANDTFISVYAAQPILYDTVLKTFYCVLPATPTALPNNQEVAAVIPTGASNKQFIPLKNKDRFINDFLTPICGVIYYYIENGNLCFDNTTMFAIPPVTIKLIGAIPGGNILTAPLNMPKNLEVIVSERVISRLLQTSNRPRDVINDGQSIPA